MAGFAFGPAATGVVFLHDRVAHGGLYIITGVIALMTLVERRSIARRLCLGIAVAHAAILILALADHSSTMAAGDVCVSAVVATACLIATRRESARRRRSYAFDSRLGPERSELLPTSD
jgi:peptidoglycan/LPS O-acetylase OafA/YrhL